MIPTVKVCIGYVVEGEPLKLPNGEYKLLPANALVNEQMKGREEFLDAALQCGAELTGKFDGSEAVTVLFTPDAWCKFDRAQEAKVAEVREAGFRDGLSDRLIGEVNREVALEDQLAKAEAELAKNKADGEAQRVVDRLDWKPNYLAQLERAEKAEAEVAENKVLIKQMSEATVQSQKEYFELRDRMIKGEPAIKITAEEMKHISDIHSKAQAYDTMIAKAGNALGEVVAGGRFVSNVEWSTGYMPPVGTKLYTRPDPKPEDAS